MTKRGTPVAAVLLAALAACTTETKTQVVTQNVPITPPESTYLVEYLPGAAPAAEGKTTFQLRVRKRSDFTAAGGLALAVKATMDMGTMSHGTPVDVVAESATPGTYDVTAYYLMGDSMMGTAAGYWSLDVTIPLTSGSETHTLYPSVASAPMGADTWRQSLYGPADAAGGATGMAINKYYLFADGPVPAAAPELKLYLTRATGMVTTFTPVTTATLTAAADAAFTAPVSGTHDGNGHWTIPLTGFALTAGTPAILYVKLGVAGEDKTTDGAAASGANAYATFTVTPREVYLVEYLPGAVAPAEGKTTFQLRVRRQGDFTAATGLSPRVSATMDMGMMSHGTPVDVVTESATPGTYDVTLYYLMGDAMMGAPAGYWSLDVAIGTQHTVFYPSVASAAMGADTWRQTLYGPADAAGGATGMGIDKYYLFADGPVSATAPELALYLTHAGNMVTTFTPVTTATLTASSDAAFTSPVAGTHGANGHWTIPLTGFSLTAGTQATVYVRLAAGGEDKTTNGAAPSGTNAYATFKVTPH